jgi:RNA polymerase sigma factor (sigma-70 family)
VDDKLAIVRRILDGEKHAFQELIENYQRLVSHIVFKMVPDNADCEDLCQEVFLKVFKNLANFRGDSKLSTWIARIAYNRCFDYIGINRLPMAEPDFDETIGNICDEGDRPDKSAEKSEIAGLLRAEIDKLPPQFRLIITLYHLDQKSYAEIGKIMNLPEGTVKSYLFRSRKMLKKQLLIKYNIKELWQ